ncbi:MAG: MGMT family protein [candidate division WOR-3 bacterium]|nr:MGMT family protein [candidate division WOR-3 bacterium]
MFDPKFPCGKALQKWGAKPGDSVVLVPHIEVDEIMKKIPEGKLITIKEICEKLAEKHSTKYCCPLVAGISIMTAANAAEESRVKGEKNITPHWRTLKVAGVLNEKFPGGAERQKKLLEKEGHKVIKKGKKYVVVYFEKYLAEL